MSHVLKRAEMLDGYLRACDLNTLNRQAREDQEYDFSSISYEAYGSLLTAANLYPLLQGCEYVILDSSADNGFPHTRPPNLICLPAKLCSESPASDDFKITLIHEAIHIHQRKFPNEWLEGLKLAGWAPIGAEKIPSEFRDRVRINPDTIGSPYWTFNSFHVPLPIFRTRYDLPSLSKVDVLWYDTRTDTLFHEPPKEFIAKYGPIKAIHQPEHPYEIYAELFSKQMLQTSNAIFENLKKL